MEKKKKLKIQYLSVIRLSIQIAFFVLLPALYISAFVGVEQIYLSIIHRTFDISSIWPQIIEAVAIIPVTVLLGRFFCGWMCGFGTLGDVIYIISNKVFKLKFRINEKVDAVFKYVKYIVLAFLVVAVWTFGSNIANESSPWDVFGIIATVGKTPDFGYAISMLTPGFIIFVIIVVASAFIERFFCRYLCPLGAIFAIVSKLRILKVHKPREHCGKCTICTRKCAMGIPLYKNDIIKSGECINCFKCITNCPRKNVSIKVAGEELRPVVTGIITVSVMTGMYYAGSIAANSIAMNYGQTSSVSQNTNINAASKSQNLSSTQSNKIYNDGDYQGTGTGFRRGKTVVMVTVKNDTIENVEVLSYEDDSQFFNRASNSVIREIINTQSAEVQAVSGATYSSNGIMSAVSDALKQALIN